MEDQIMELARDLQRRARPGAPSVFDRVLDAAMEDPGLQVDLFRLLDVLPALSSDQEVSRHVREYLLSKPRDLPPVLRTALRAAGSSLFSGAAGRSIRMVAGQMAERFIAGESVPRALPVLARLHREGFASSVDILGETAVSEAEAEEYAARYTRLIDTLVRESAGWPASPLAEDGSSGPLPRVNVSVKLSALSPRLDPLDHSGSVERLLDRALPLFQQAAQRGAALVVDMEQWDLHGIAWDVFETLVTRPELSRWPHFGIVIQAYLREAPRDVQRLLSLARRRGAPLSVRLVKGAYWDYEVAHARQHGYPCPVLEGKERTDAAFEVFSRQLLGSADLAVTGIGSHNLRSIAQAVVAARRGSGAPGSFEVQMLYGMAEATRAALRDLGLRVRVYAPVGELLPGIAYLVRRLLENSANTGFLRRSTHEKRPIEELAAAPAAPKEEAVAPPDGGEFHNCAHADFTDADVRRRFQEAITARRAALPVVVPVCVGGTTRTHGRKLVHWCPGNRRQEASLVTCAAPADAALAVSAAQAAWPAWRDTSREERIRLLERLAAALEHGRFDLAAAQCLEVGKPLREADADVAEAIDLCRYYARTAAVELRPRRRADLPGEDNLLWYEGRGVTAVIAPWNFPLAILCGMTAAALVSGNTVIMKPAEQSSAVALLLYQALQECGAPPGVAQLLPGAGEEVGAALVADPGVAQVAFTGSRDVGLAILAQAAKVAPGQGHLKHVVCEMGGKNAVIVDDDADLDEAVADALLSAFGYAGQKCSACSRLIVLDAVYDRFVPRLVQAARSLRIRPPEDPSCEMGPVIDEASCRRLTAVIGSPGGGVEPLFVGIPPSDAGWFVPPAIFLVRDPGHPLARQELFGPVLCVLRAGDFDAALQAAADSEYALTGGLFSRSPSRIEAARRRFRVGNLYINRAITGAMADRQPFGGLKLSGGGVKAGGPGYLLQFSDARASTENTMRKGFSP